MTYTYPEITTIDTFYTDENGRLVTPKTLKYGKGYSLVEVKAPYGYVLDPTPLYFDVSEDLSNSQNEISLIKVTMNNTPQKGITKHSFQIARPDETGADDGNYVWNFSSRVKISATADDAAKCRWLQPAQHIQQT